MSGGYFITGTGTGVGKTFTTCALIYAARAQGITVRAKKPVLSGASEVQNDSMRIADALGTHNLAEITKWSFAAPLSPHRAAALEGQEIDFDALVAWCREGEGLCFVEGVGGAMVPLMNTHTTCDWAAALGWPVILVAGSYLGSISHTLTALKCLRMAGVNVTALVINETPDSSVSMEETLAGLSPFVQDIAHRAIQRRVASPQAATEIRRLVELLG